MKAKIASFVPIGAKHGLLTFEVFADFRKEFDKLKDKDVEVSVKKWFPAKSDTANAYLWKLCTDIAKAVGISKEEVYRCQIREAGEHTPLPIKEEAVEDFSRIWAAHGIGWFVDVVDDSKLPGYKLCFAYQGSSTYDSKQMSRLIDATVQEAKNLGLETRPQEEIDALLKGV